jgi:hypothetical protein
MTSNNPTLHIVDGDDNISIAKPAEFSLSMFKSRQADTVAGVVTLQTGLPVHSMASARDFVRLHPSEDYWSDELCFVRVPTPGARETTHLICEDLALKFLPSGRIKRHRLALAAIPGDKFFLCEVPTRNLDNGYNRDNLAACEQARRRWVQTSSRRDEGVDGYTIEQAKDADAFPEPRWPKQELEELILLAHKDRMIAEEKHPGLLRLIGAKQEVS